MTQNKALFTSRKGNPTASVTLAGGSKIARVYKQNFTGRVTRVTQALGLPYLLVNRALN